MTRLLICFTLSLIWSFGAAQAIKVGVVLPRGGAQAQAAEASYQVARVYLAQSRIRGGVFGLPLELIVRDGGGRPETLLRAVRTLTTEDQVHALICCSSEADVQALLSSGLSDGVPTLLLQALPPEEAAAYWLFSLKPTTQDLLRSILLELARVNQVKLALMAPDNSYGDEAKAALDTLLTPDVFELVAEQRYSPSVSVLTPEALLVATRQPDSVLVWGATQSNHKAYTGLRRRGYEGPVFLNADMLKTQNVSAPAVLEGARFTVPPVFVQATLEPEHPSYQASRDFVSEMSQVIELGRLELDGAYLYDALHLLERAFEQALAYGGPQPDNVAVFRQSTRDALIGLSAFAGATGVFDFSEADHRGPEPRSLVTAELKNGELERVTD